MRERHESDLIVLLVGIAEALVTRGHLLTPSPSI
ncbi:hypothetical protein ABIC94_002957 [Variovorax paradoxus]